MTATLIDRLSDLIQGFENWGYVIVFIIVLLECQAFLGLFMPGESMVMVTGFLAGQEILDVRWLIGVVAVAAIMGDSIGYEFGRWLGRDWLRRHGPSFWLRPERLDKMDAFFERHGGLSVLFAHFLHVGRALMPFLAGAARLPYPRFLIFNAIGCVLWATIYCLVGYYFGQNWHLLERWIGRASIILGILAGMIFATIWLWRWIASRELEIRRWWEQFCARPDVVNFRQRFARHIDWLQQRLSPEGYLGIHLTVGVFLLLASAAVFGGTIQQIGTRDLFATMDLRVAEWFANRTAAAASRTMIFASYLGSVAWLATLCGGAALLLLVRREWHRLQLLLLAAPGGIALDFILKQLFRQPRPQPQGGSSFLGLLDGDLMSATLVYGALAYILVRSTQRWGWRALVILGTILLLLLLTLSSLYLGAHFFSDLIAALLEGAVWLLFCISGVEIVRWREKAHRAAAPAL